MMFRYGLLMRSINVLWDCSRSLQTLSGSVDDPAAGQQHKAAFGLGRLDDLQTNAVSFGSLCSVFPGVALIDPSQFHMLAGDLLHRLGQHANLGTILLVGRSHMQRQQVAQRIDSRMHLGSLAALGPIVASAR